MEDSFIITGGKPLSGSIRLSGAKNVALKSIIAALLFESRVTIHNVPRIRDVMELIHLIKKLGVNIEFTDTNTLTIDPGTLKLNKVDFLHASKIRVAFLLFPALLYRFGECFIPNPGGCRLGERPIDRIVAGMTSLGVVTDYDSSTGYYHAVIAGQPGGTYRFNKPSHTGTELLVMLGARSQKEITIHNVSLEPEIDELITFLNDAGADIRRDATSIICRPAATLRQRKPFTIGPDRNEAVTYACLGLATKGSVTLSNISPSRLESFIEAVKASGNSVTVTDGGITFSYSGEVNPVDITTAPHPGFMTDWQPNWAVLMTQAEGSSIIHETVFENRFAYVSELQKLGAKIEFFEPDVKDPATTYHFNWTPSYSYPQAIKVWGGKPLHGAVLRIQDLRAGASLVIAALVANGESVISGVSIIERGYENIVEKIRSLGGTIRKV